MKALNKHGLANPSIEIIKFSDGKRRIALFATNRFQSPRYSKRFSFFEELFDKFLISEIEDGMYEKIVKLLKDENDGKEISETQNIKSEVIGFLETKFEKYLDDNMGLIETNLNSIINTAFPKIVFKKTKNLSFIQTTTDEKDTGVVFFLVMNKEVARKRNIEDFIYNDGELQSIVENLCYKNKITSKSITVYYYIANDREISLSNFTPVLKNSLMNGLVQIALIPINDYQKNNSKRIISLHLLSDKDSKDNKQNQTLIGDN